MLSQIFETRSRKSRENSGSRLVAVMVRVVRPAGGRVEEAVGVADAVALDVDAGVAVHREVRVADARDRGLAGETGGLRRLPDAAGEQWGEQGSGRGSSQYDAPGSGPPS